MAFDRIAVVGAGAWGTALANVIARAGRTVLLAARHRAAADVLAKRRESPRLPGLQIDTRVEIASVGTELARYDAVLFAGPAQEMRAAPGAIAPSLRDGTPVIACAQGIQRGTHRFMTEVIAEAAPTALPAILSGPSFAADRSEEHTSELQSQSNLVCRLLLEKKKTRCTHSSQAYA